MTADRSPVHLVYDADRGLVQIRVRNTIEAVLTAREFLQLAERVGTIATMVRGEWEVEQR